MRVGIVIPAYNAGQTLSAVIARLPYGAGQPLPRTWIVDDGSTDQTAEVARGLARSRPELELKQLPRNGGYGSAVKCGLAAARAEGVDVAVCLHADGQYAPELLPALVSALVDRRLDILQGSRIASGTALSGGMPLYKYLANRALTTLENRVYGLRLSDYHSGYLLYSRRALTTLPFEQFSSSFDFDLEVIAASRALGMAIGEYPIPTHYGDEISHLEPITYGLRALRVMVNYLRGHYHRGGTAPLGANG
jgi:glycosyltransferase involved in cell wall biosynthesis